ncbi:Armadillo [Cynara cardunculus var. scolymus]|uniref:Armadillo n=1 Tax=Cynara cardunculus var. scolymus TaxID=59895 RepID=A0A103XE18_CYNCS|nr:Armadillo [Cynara cardunculus var. scolymus]
MDFATGEDHHHQPIEHLLSSPIVLSERIRQAVDESKSYKLECSDVGKLVDRLSQMLRSFVRLTNSTPSFYDRPVRRVFSDVTRNLNRALTLVRKCRRRSVFLRVVTIVGAADFRKVLNILDASIGDMKWLLSIFDASGDISAGVVLSLPPIASNDPILAWVWSYISSLYLSPLNVKIEVANELCSLANDNDRNKKMIAEEGGIPPLMKLLKEAASPESQIAGATALFNLANDRDRARLIAGDVGVSTIVQEFGKSPIRVQIAIAKLIARMAENDPLSQEGFARENVIRPLVTLLSFETFVDEDKLHDQYRYRYQKQSIHSILEINKQITRNYQVGSSSSSTWSMNRKERESEPPELKLELKTSCSKALWMLARGNLANCRILTDTKGLLCLAKIIETETGELQINCLMTVMEITLAAESNADLRRATFKTNSPAAKAVVDQFLRLIQESEKSEITMPAIRAIGSLARTFPARETRVIGPLVKQLSHQNPEIGLESAIALGKFVCPDNFLCTEHSKTVIEFDGVVPLMRLLRGSEKTQYHALVVLCYLALHAGNSEALVQARVLTALEGADRAIVGQHSELKELVVQAIYHLNIKTKNLLEQ